MRLSIPADAARLVVSLQTRVTELRYACRDEQCRLRPTNAQRRQRLYCPQCTHRYGEPDCLFPVGHYAERIAKDRQQKQGAKAADCDRRGYSLGKRCPWPGCNVPITNAAKHCHQHAALVQRRPLHYRFERQQTMTQADMDRELAEAVRHDGWDSNQWFRMSEFVRALNPESPLLPFQVRCWTIAYTLRQHEQGLAAVRRVDGAVSP